MLVRAAQEKKDFQLVGLLEENGHDLIGTKAREFFPSLEKTPVFELFVCLITIIWGYLTICPICFKLLMTLSEC